MPLTRATVTAASRIMLPAYVVLFTGIGLNYLITGPRLLSSPALAYADAWMPLPAWGGLFLTAAALMAGALVMRNRGLYRYALLVCFVAMATWAGFFVLAALNTSTSSPGAALWPGFVGVACLATYRSLTVGEV